MLKIALVGAGSIGITHLQALERTDCFSLCGICDTNHEKAEELSKQYGVPYFLDYHEIPEAIKPDAVILNLPHFLHCESTVFFLEQGIHVLCEKPMANSVKECNKMLLAAEKSNKKLAIGHVQRYINANRVLKELIDSKLFGKLCMVQETRTTNYFHPDRPKWFFEKEKSGGGIVMNYGAHILDKLYYALGSHSVPEVTSVFSNPKNEYDIEGHAQFFLQFQNGVSAAVTFSSYGDYGYDTIYYFTDGAVKVEDTYRLFYHKDGKWIPWENDKEAKNAFQMQLEEFYNYIVGKPSIVVTGEYGKSVIEAIEKIYQKF